MSNTPTELQCARWWSRGWARLWWQSDIEPSTNVEPSDSSVLHRAQKAHIRMCAAFDAEHAAQAGKGER